MTTEQLYLWGTKELKTAGIDDALTDAWLLLEHVTGFSRARYYMILNESVNQTHEENYRELIERRKNRIPLQHLTGVQEFMGLEFMVNEHVLIPRQDTEILVETVLDRMPDDAAVMDMCTGSGCILISLLCCAGKKQSTDAGRCLGVDISGEALAMAKKNAEKLLVEVPFIESSLFEQVTGQYDIIVSNPPYIRTGVIQELQDEVRLHDPMLALDGREDGLYFYRHIIEESPMYLKKGGELYFEIGYDQAEAVSNLMKKQGFEEITLKKDLSGLDRVVFGVYNKSEK